jgi:hypothetical protein
MIGMKKPPTAASVSIRPVAVPTCSDGMLLTLGATANQAANPKMRKKPMPMPSGHSVLFGMTGIKASNPATTKRGAKTNMRKFLLRSA